MVYEHPGRPPRKERLLDGRRIGNCPGKHSAVKPLHIVLVAQRVVCNHAAIMGMPVQNVMIKEAAKLARIRPRRVRVMEIRLAAIRTITPVRDNAPPSVREQRSEVMFVVILVIPPRL